MDEIEYKLPQNGDQLFKSDEDRWHDACIGHFDQGWDTYAFGYKMAGDLIIKHMDYIDKNYLIFPIIFLYRHYIALRLKEIIKNSYSLLYINNNNNQIHYTEKHNINILWNETIILIRKALEHQAEHYVDSLGKLIKEFNKVDPSSYCSRYPVDTKGIPFKYDINYINLRNLSEVIEGMANLLEEVSIGISENLGLKSEM
jgi:hypothetical protein